ncbi:MAG: YceI family protein [Planctomycetota bacterium]|jgi:polyisoprenoid-binding protein YceI
MPRATCIVSAAFLSTLAAVLVATAMSGPAAEASGQSPATPSYEVDPVHSSVFFRIRHLGVSNFYGRFNTITGSYRFDEANPADAKFEFEVRADSVDTGNSRRDGHLKSPDFFNVAEYPTITFRSGKVEKAGSDGYTVTGELTLLGWTRLVSANVTWLGAGNTPQGYKSGLEARFLIKRSDFGMNTYVDDGMLGDRVRLTVAIEGARR